VLFRSVSARDGDPRSPLRRAAGWLRHAVRRTGWALEDRRLAAEGRRGVLGPAHRRWRGNSVASNRDWWERYDWTAGGEEWTASPQWKEALVEHVLHALIPGGVSVLEIGPGGGRWSAELAGRARHLVVLDVSEAALESCRERLAPYGNVSFVLGDGRGLAGVAGASIDAIWSFDVFVHIAPLDLAGYLDEIARVLVPEGVAVIHHADGRNRGRLLSRHGWRAPMSRELIAALARERGLAVQSQFDSWGEGGRFDLSAYGDAITVLRRARG
jgi:ubiquinone/menaquinone biosynthesis C-methylase UbiE